MATRKHRKSPFPYIVVRRPDGTQVNVSTKTKNTTAASLIADHVKLLLAGDDPNPITMLEALDIAAGICKTANRQKRLPVPAIAYLRGLLEEHTGSDVYLRQKGRVIDILEHVLADANRTKVLRANPALLPTSS